MIYRTSRLRKDTWKCVFGTRIQASGYGSKQRSSCNLHQPASSQKPISTKDSLLKSLDVLLFGSLHLWKQKRLNQTSPRKKDTSDVLPWTRWGPWSSRAPGAGMETASVTMGKCMRDSIPVWGYSELFVVRYSNDHVVTESIVSQTNDLHIRIVHSYVDYFIQRYHACGIPDKKAHLV